MVERFKKILFVVILTFLICGVALGSTETLMQFMMRSSSSMSIVPGQPSLITTVSCEQLIEGGYEITLMARERGGMDAAIASITVHVFEDNYMLEEVAAFESQMEKGVIPANSEVILKERLNVNPGQWIGYDLLVGEKKFSGLCQCGSNAAGQPHDETDGHALEPEEAAPAEDDTTPTGIVFIMNESEPVAATETAEETTQSGSEESPQEKETLRENVMPAENEQMTSQMDQTDYNE